MIPEYREKNGALEIELVENRRSAHGLCGCSQGTLLLSGHLLAAWPNPGF